MDHKRHEAQRAAAEARARKAPDDLKDVISALRTLGYRLDQARQAAKLCEAIPDASVEEKVKRALTYFLRPSTQKRIPGPGAARGTMATAISNAPQAAFIGSA